MLDVPRAKTPNKPKLREPKDRSAERCGLVQQSSCLATVGALWERLGFYGGHQIRSAAP
jgi:hypothetical protein